MTFRGQRHGRPRLLRRYFSNWLSPSVPSVSSVQELRCRPAFHDLVSGIPRFRNRQRIFSGIVELAYVSAQLTHAFANRAVWHGNYPIMGTMSVYVVGELGLVVRGWPRYTQSAAGLSGTSRSRANSRTVRPCTPSQNFKSTIPVSLLRF